MSKKKLSEKRLADYLILKQNITPEILESCITEFKNTPQEASSVLSPTPNTEKVEMLAELENLLRYAKTLKDGDTQRANPSDLASEVTTVEGNSSAFISEQDSALKQKVFESRYKILETLGEGGMGVVKRAYDRVLKREVALKEIKLSKKEILQLSKPQQLKLWRFKREAALTAKLEHPNIVPIYDLQENSQEQLYYTMRKVEGKSLRSLLKENSSSQEMLESPKNEYLPILLKISDALHYAHSQGVVHRDLKPENIMVGEFGEVYLVDWGIAKEFRSLKDSPLEPKETKEIDEEEFEKEYQTLGAIGTPFYMAPEQKNCMERITPRMDIYALGKILKECFLLQSPFEEMKEKIKKEEEHRIFSYKSQLPSKKPSSVLPKDIEAIVKKATQEIPQKRYLTVKEMAQDIERYIKGIPVSAREYTGSEVLFKFIKRNLRSVGIAFFLVVLIARDLIFSNTLQVFFVASLILLELNFKILFNAYQALSRLFEKVEDQDKVVFFAFFFILFFFGILYFLLRFLSGESG
jgi:serine/threonine protein kinase